MCVMCMSVLCVHVCMHVCMCAVYMWRSDDNLKGLVLSLHPVGSRMELRLSSVPMALHGGFVRSSYEYL